MSILLLLCLPAALRAEQVALVIGNADYRNVAALDNPPNDAAAVSAALAAQGFDVTTANNLGRIELRDTLRRFRDRADRADVALVYYAGHGIEIGGINYLVPVDARLEDERDAGLEMVDLDLVLRQISGAARMKMVVLDACRNNPFVTRMRSTGGSRAVRQGLGDIRSTQADTLVAYAAAAGAITPDGAAGENSPFTAAFLAALDGPPTDVRRMLGRVRDRMRETVPGAAPFVYSSLGGGEFVINPNSRRAGSDATGGTPDGSISRDFVRIDRDGTVDDWNAFLVKYESQSSHPLYAFALEKRERLLALAPPQAPATDPARRVPETVSVPPTASTAAAPPAQITAPAPVPEPAPVPAPPPLSDPRDLARAIQTELRDAGCYLGRIDGLLGRGSKRGLAGFSQQAGIQITLRSTADPQHLQELLDTLRAHPDVDCPQPKPQAKAQPQSQPKTQPQTQPGSRPAPTTQPTTQPAPKTAQKPSNSRPADCPIQEHLRANRPECGGSVYKQPDLPGIKKQQMPCPIQEELRLARPDCL
nr:caspase family protein [Seohaeicola saemankumensis]